MEIQTKYIAAGCNCTNNCHVLTEDFIFFGSNHSLAAYDLKVKNEKNCVFTKYYILTRILGNPKRADTDNEKGRQRQQKYPTLNDSIAEKYPRSIKKLPSQA